MLMVALARLHTNKKTFPDEQHYHGRCPPACDTWSALYHDNFEKTVHCILQGGDVNEKGGYNEKPLLMTCMIQNNI